MSRRGSLAALGASLWGMLAGRAAARALSSDEEVLFPTGTARLLPNGRIELRISAWVFEFEPRRGARTIFARIMGVDTSDLSAEAQALFAERSRYFLTDSERGKEITLRFDLPGGPSYQLPATDRAGRSSGRAVLDLAPAPELIGWHAARADGTRFDGRAVLVPDEGLSIISDIDDTIKISNVADRNELLKNTFLRPYKPVPGMAAAYRAMAGRAPGTAFHYLSNSPLQLLPPLDAFLRDGDFPPGSMHLRESTAWTRLLPVGAKSRDHKPGVLADLLADFPRRRFLLVGDSGEEDPENYAALARAHPERDITIIIRALRGESRDDPRMIAAFDGIAPDRWHLLAADGGDWPV